MINVNLESENVTAALKRIADAGLDMTPVLKNIGEILLNSTRRRFQTGMGPTGEAWTAKTDTTHDARPLIGETKSLSTQIHYEVQGTELYVGSSTEYAATHQFGAAKGAYGQTQHGVALPFNTIPARPFLGLSTDDESDIINYIRFSFSSFSYNVNPSRPANIRGLQGCFSFSSFSYNVNLMVLQG